MLLKIKIIFLFFYFAIFSAYSSFANSEKYSLRFNFTKGEVKNYTIQFKGEGEGGISPTVLPFKLNLNMRISTKVLSVSPDGIADVEIRPIDIKVSLKPEIILPIPTDYSKNYGISSISSQGRIVKTIGFSDFPTNSDADIALKLIAENSVFIDLILPESPIGIGDSWNAEIIKSPHPPVLATYTFDSIKKIKNIKCAVIKSNITFPVTTLNVIPTGDYNPIRGVTKLSSIYYFDIEKGVLLKYEGALEGTFKGLVTEFIDEKINLADMITNIKGNVIME